jgi:hypothetical protein
MFSYTTRFSPINSFNKSPEAGSWKNHQHKFYVQFKWIILLNPFVWYNESRKLCLRVVKKNSCYKNQHFQQCESLSVCAGGAYKIEMTKFARKDKFTGKILKSNVNFLFNILSNNKILTFDEFVSVCV